MNVLFLSISSMPHLSSHSISLDLLREFKKQGHDVYVVAGMDKKDTRETYLSQEAGCQILRVKIGGNKKANVITKGLTTLRLPQWYMKAIRQYYTDVKFDLVMYPTPPITHYQTVKFIKKRDGARSYLLLKDIFPQNAVDIGMMRKSGPMSLLYRCFRAEEKRLYDISDHIGCMSQANVDYVLRHNPEVDPAKVEICPNAIEVRDMSVSAEVRAELREKYGLPQDKKIFVYGGNLGKPQGIPFLLECLDRQKDNPNAWFLIVGDGTEYKKMEAWFENTKPQNMKLMKRLPKEDYDWMVAACDVGMIFLDHRFTIPNFPSRLLSYMQAKLPVLCCTDPNTDVGKVCEEGGFGWWCGSDDYDAFGTLVERIVVEDLPIMGERGFVYLNEHYMAKDACQTVLNHFGGK